MLPSCAEDRRWTLLMLLLLLLLCHLPLLMPEVNHLLPAVVIAEVGVCAGLGGIPAHNRIQAG
jgi:sorbitol-specific phosphotransferase system component IIBC